LFTGAVHLLAILFPFGHRIAQKLFDSRVNSPPDCLLLAANEKRPLRVYFLCAARENRTLHVQYPFVDISCRFALEISHKGFDSRYALCSQSYASGRKRKKTPGGVYFLCAPCRPTSRTSPDTLFRQLDTLAETLREPTVKELVAQLSHIMSRHNGAEK
jgi:hypothetical protein